MSRTREELREYAFARCAELLRKERSYELHGHPSGEPPAVVVNAVVGGNMMFEVGWLCHASPTPNGGLPWLGPSPVDRFPGLVNSTTLTCN
jgi:hypothetical protein